MVAHPVGRSGSDLDACRRAHSPLIAWIRALVCAEADPIHWTKSLSARSSNSFSCSLKMARLRNACVSIEPSSWSENRRRAVLNAWILSCPSGAACDRECVNGKEAATIGSGIQVIYLVPKWEFLHEPRSPHRHRSAVSLDLNRSKSWSADLARQLNGSSRKAIPDWGEIAQRRKPSPRQTLG